MLDGFAFRLSLSPTKGEVGLAGGELPRPLGGNKKADAQPTRDMGSHRILERRDVKLC